MILLVVGDFNASLGIDNTGHETCMGKFNVGGSDRHLMDPNSERLFYYVETNNLCITNTYFRHPARHNYTFYDNCLLNPRTATRANLKEVIDFILCNQRYKSSIMSTRVYNGAILDLIIDYLLLIFV